MRQMTYRQLVDAEDIIPFIKVRNDCLNGIMCIGCHFSLGRYYFTLQFAEALHAKELVHINNDIKFYVYQMGCMSYDEDSIFKEVLEWCGIKRDVKNEGWIKLKKEELTLKINRFKNL